MKKHVILSLLLVAADQVIKMIIRRQPLGSRLFVLPPWVEITHVTNTGAAFSLMASKTLLISLISIVLLCAFVFCCAGFFRLTPAARTAAACLVGGGLGNLLDRMLFGGVTDYIRLLFIDFPVFNFADILITLSAFTLIALLLADCLEEPVGERMHESEH